MSGWIVTGGLVHGDGAPVTRPVFIDGRTVGTSAPAGAATLEASGCWVFPGFIDLRARLRDERDAVAACAAGFTMVLQSPEAATCPGGGPRVLRAAALTRDLAGEELGEVPGDAPVLSQGARPLARAGVLRRALQYARPLRALLMLHAEDPSLSGKGVLSEGLTATRLGLPGVPASAESSIVARDLELLGEVGGRVHFSHVTTARSLALIRDARSRGLDVSCDVTSHHLSFDSSAAEGFNPRARVWPPLREAADVEALRQGVRDGTVDAITSDHLRVDAIDREHPFEDCAPGFEAYPGFLARLRSQGVDASTLARVLGQGPARLLGRAWSLAPGAPADLVVFDPRTDEVVATLVDGEMRFERKPAA